MRFQSYSIEFCQQICQIGNQLTKSADEASVALQDDVSKTSLQRIESIADKLVRMGTYSLQGMTAALQKTRTELDRWNGM